MPKRGCPGRPTSEVDLNDRQTATHSPNQPTQCARKPPPWGVVFFRFFWKKTKKRTHPTNTSVSYLMGPLQRYKQTGHHPKAYGGQWHRQHRPQPSSGSKLAVGIGSNCHMGSGGGEERVRAILPLQPTVSGGERVDEPATPPG